MVFLNLHPSALSSLKNANAFPGDVVHTAPGATNRGNRSDSFQESDCAHQETKQQSNSKSLPHGTMKCCCPLLFPLVSLLTLARLAPAVEQQRTQVFSVRERLWNQMERFHTGLLSTSTRSDLSLIPSASSHPLDSSSLSSSSSSERHLQPPDTQLFQPLRVAVDTTALDSLLASDETTTAKIDYIKQEILPLATTFWSQALSVVPVQGPLVISPLDLSNRAHCGAQEFTEVPVEHTQEGVADTDIILYVSASAAPDLYCTSNDVLAVGIPCNFDSFDRPTAGAIHVCLNQLDLTEDISSISTKWLDAVKGELAHVLGASPFSFRFYWDAERGEPRTPRPFQPTTVTCVDGIERTLIVPGENTLTFVEPQPGRRYASIVTPKVQAVARNHFDCQSLEGARLENHQPAVNKGACFGTSWDERFFYSELLYSGVVSRSANILSPLTLALLEDSGWYQANYSTTSASPWGLGAGCDFVNQDCLLSDTTPPTIPDYSRGYFCNSSGSRGCSPEATHKLACTVIDYASIIPDTLRPPPEFQYFGESMTLGGPRQLDYCPVYGSSYNGLTADQLDCRDPTNLGAGAINIYSEVYGESSKCLESSTGEGLCYRTACVKEDRTLRVNVRGEWLTCEFDFQVLEVQLGSGGLFPVTLTCPRLSSACPHLVSCPYQCAGRGVCNYQSQVEGSNTTNLMPQCECFDRTDTSAGCTESFRNPGLIPDANESESPSMGSSEAPSLQQADPTATPPPPPPMAVPSLMPSQAAMSLLPSEQPSLYPTRSSNPWVEPSSELSPRLGTPSPSSMGTESAPSSSPGKTSAVHWSILIALVTCIAHVGN